MLLINESTPSNEMTEMTTFRIKLASVTLSEVFHIAKISLMF